MLKESYRLNKIVLLNDVSEKQIKLRILFSLSNTGYKQHKDLSFKEISSDMTLMLEKIIVRINKGIATG